ncbi:hypothetical protein EYZ11_008513 [Aspergillus tanneri]|uniref:Uncharacterized protein n=1 Tax=Aspergillus tanneri TaxID=1220188 RepID=A0A4V3UNP8_9EURO|nr:hypothetical protein EYZ11_008513 [Aspergillus tanneri]
MGYIAIPAGVMRDGTGRTNGVSRDSDGGKVDTNVVHKDGRLEKIECDGMDSFDEDEQRRRVVWLGWHTIGTPTDWGSTTTPSRKIEPMSAKFL